jgi:ADP-ribose pyrophosphatase YjhB (NUDIX family)
VNKQRLRAIALALVEHPDRPAILVSEGYDATRDEHFHRLLGGGIDFGERGEDAVRRELAEEIGVDIRVQRLAGTIENIFTYEGRPGHELVLVYKASFEDPTLYRRDRFDGIEEDPVNAIWHVLEGPGSEIPVYPPGALELRAE